MKISSLFLTVALIITSFSLFGGTASWLNELSPIENGRFTVVSEDGHLAVSDAFRNAKSTIKMSIYRISDKMLIDDLVGAANKGVKVTVIFDNKSLKNPKYDGFAKELTKGGVKVVRSSAQFSISHAKSFLIDDKLLFISTMNLVGHYDHMRDSGLFLTNKDIIKSWLEIFDADLSNAAKNSGYTPKVIHPNLLVSPTNAEGKLVDLINAAEKEIRLTSENLGNNEVMAALMKAERRRVEVEVILPECNLGNDGTFNYPYMYALKGAGVENRVTPAPYSANSLFMHQKMIVVDDKFAYLGSENFSYNSLRLAREIGLVFSDKKLVQEAKELFERDWATSKALPVTPPSNCLELTTMQK